MRWKVTSDKDIASLEKHGMYELVPITSVPNGRKVISTRWVYKVNSPLRELPSVELGFEERFDSVPVYIDNTFARGRKQDISSKGEAHHPKVLLRGGAREGRKDPHPLCEDEASTRGSRKSISISTTTTTFAVPW